MSNGEFIKTFKVKKLKILLEKQNLRSKHKLHPSKCIELLFHPLRFIYIILVRGVHGSVRSVLDRFFAPHL